MIRLVFLGAGVAVLGGLGMLIDAKSQPPVVRPQESPGEYRIFAPGRVETATQQIELRPQLAGRIDRLWVKEGQFVEEGQLLLELDSSQYRQEEALAAAEVDLAQAQLERLYNGARPEERREVAALYHAKVAELRQAQLSWERIKQLRKAKAVAQQQADDQQSRVTALTAEVEAAKARAELILAPPRGDEVRMAKARVDSAKARLELARVQLERARLRAPCAGRVLRLNVEPGELAGPETPEPALVMADTRKLLVKAFVEEIDAPRLQLGMPVEVAADGLPERKFRGRVTRLAHCMGRKELRSDQPDERYDTKTRETWIELETAEALVVGLRVDVTIDPRTFSAGPGEAPESERIGPGDTAADVGRLAHSVAAGPRDSWETAGVVIDPER